MRIQAVQKHTDPTDRNLVAHPEPWMEGSGSISFPLTNGSETLVFLPIPDPGSKNSNKREGWKKCVVIPFYVATNFTKLNIILVSKCRRKKIWTNFQRILELFTQKIVTKLSKIWVRDRWSEIRDLEKTYSVSRIQGSKRHRIPDPDPQHWIRPYGTRWTMEKFFMFGGLTCCLCRGRTCQSCSTSGGTVSPCPRPCDATGNIWK
jgi:hypothetical protein